MTSDGVAQVIPGLTSRRFRALGCHHEILTTDAGSADDAERTALLLLDELDLAASRFRADSQVSLIAAAAEHGPVTTPVGPLLASCVAAALHAARITDGLVDPTVGRAVAASGYDADLEVVRARSHRESHRSDGSLPRADPLAGPDPTVVPSGRPHGRPSWRDVHLDEASRSLEVPAGTLLDLGATAKAHAADLLAARMAATLPGGFLVNLGGDIAVSGDLPEGGWEIGVAGAGGAILQVVVSTGQALTTSSTRLRTWTSAGVERHHIVDPRTGSTAAPTWAQVTCVGATCLEANAASTAAIVLGEDAPAWLTAHGIPARLDHADGSVVLTPGWPKGARPVA